MNKVDERKRKNNVHRTSRSKRRRLQLGPLEKLPSKCLQRILSFVTYDKVAQLRQVSKAFNEAAMKVLHEGQKELEGRLEKEMERAEKYRIHFSINARSSNDKARFLMDLHAAMNNCVITYWNYTDYFVAGKLLDQANCLLKDLDTSAVVPYLIEDVHDLKPHPLLGPISADSQRALLHFKSEFLDSLERNCSTLEELQSTPAWQRDVRNDLERDMLYERNKEKTQTTNLLKNLRLKINRGNEMGREMLKMIVKLKENLLELTQRAERVDQEVEMVVNCGKKKPMVKSDEGGRDCLFRSSSRFGDAKGMTLIPGKKRTTLATLPSFCVRNILSYFNLDKTARMREVCASFNEVCEEKLNEKLEKVKQKIEFQIKYYEQDAMYSSWIEFNNIETNLMKDLRSLLRLCEDNYKRHLGTNFRFVAGKVLDEAEGASWGLYHPFRAQFGNGFEGGEEFESVSRPHSSLFRLVDMVHRSIAHFTFTVVPEHFPAAQNPLYVPDFLTTGESTTLEKESQLNLEEIEALVEEAEAKVKEQNGRNRKCLKFISGLKKKVSVLNEEISEKINVLKKLEENSSQNFVNMKCN